MYAMYVCLFKSRPKSDIKGSAQWKPRALPHEVARVCMDLKAIFIIGPEWLLNKWFIIISFSSPLLWNFQNSGYVFAYVTMLYVSCYEAAFVTEKPFPSLPSIWYNFLSKNFLLNFFPQKGGMLPIYIPTASVWVTISGASSATLASSTSLSNSSFPLVSFEMS